MARRSKTPTGRKSIAFTFATGGLGGYDHEGPTREAWLTDVYGLVIHTSVLSNMAPKWAVSHMRSGYAISYADTWEAALHLANLLGEPGSWNRDLEEITADVEFHKVVSEVVREHGKKSYKPLDPLMNRV